MVNIDFIGVIVSIENTLLPGLTLVAVLILLLRKKAEIYLKGLANDIIAEFLHDIAENPDIAVKILQPVVEKFIKRMESPGSGGGSGDLKLGSFKVPGWLAQLVIGKVTEKGKEATANVFG